MYPGNPFVRVGNRERAELILGMFFRFSHILSVFSDSSDAHEKRVCDIGYEDPSIEIQFSEVSGITVRQIPDTFFLPVKMLFSVRKFNSFSRQRSISRYLCRFSCVHPIFVKKK